MFGENFSIECKQCGGDMKAKTVSTASGAGCFLILVGIALLLFVPVLSVILLVVGLIVGSRTKKYWICQKCKIKLEKA